MSRDGRWGLGSRVYFAEWMRVEGFMSIDYLEWPQVNAQGLSS
ncbi:MAG: hypothetical protein OXH52_02060 [Gammaproteobacteria bacterium]|nr:hypothetical protein [Gammaproteobacteria bacterium]